MIEKVSSIDYLQKWSSQESSFNVELSFTQLDFKILDLIISDECFTVDAADVEQALQLCFNIWPKGRGVLHQLVMGCQDTLKKKSK